MTGPKRIIRAVAGRVRLKGNDALFPSALHAGWVALALAYGPLINLLVLSVGLIFTWRQFRNARIVREQQNFSAILARSSDINTRTEASHYRKIAADCFTNAAHHCPAGALGPVDDDEAYKAYWGSRSYFLDLIILILQVWLLADRPSHLRGDFAGWEVIARPYRGRSGA